MIKFFDNRINKFTEEDDHLFLGVDGKVYEIFSAENRAGSYLDKIDVTELYTIYFMGVDIGKEEINIDK